MSNLEWKTQGDSIVTPVDNKTRKEINVKMPSLYYQAHLNPDGNQVFTPLEIEDFDEIASGKTKNKEKIDFRIINRKQPAESLTIEVFDDSRLIYSEPDTTQFLSSGEHYWQWDGYDISGVLDTETLKSNKLKIVITAKSNDESQVIELKLKNKNKEVDWIDAKINRNSKTVEVTIRASFSDGGVEGTGISMTYSDLEAMAKSGIEHYWSRNGKRANGIDTPVNTAKGRYKISVKAEVNVEPKAGNFPLIEKLDKKFGRATSLALFRKIYHNVGFWSDIGFTTQDADEDFKHTTAHELGHLILNEYGDGGLIPEYSWSHKETSSAIIQTPNENNPTPTSGEIDLMHYHSDFPKSYLDYWGRSVAAEQDVKGLVWLTRIKFND